MLTIQPATQQYALAISQLLIKTWEHTYTYLSKETLQLVFENWLSENSISAQLSNPSIFFPIALEGDKLVGIATAHCPSDRIILSRVYVDPAHQGKGIGSQLIQAVINHYPDKKTLSLHVEVLNTKAQEFYKKAGFVEVGKDIEALPGQNIEVIAMSKDL